MPLRPFYHPNGMAASGSAMPAPLSQRFPSEGPVPGATPGSRDDIEDTVSDAQRLLEPCRQRRLTRTRARVRLLGNRQPPAAA